jgi:hypothetical protein
MKPKRSRNYRREALRQKIKFLEAVERATWEVLSVEIDPGENKERLGHWRRGFLYALEEMKKAS